MFTLQLYFLIIITYVDVVLFLTGKIKLLLYWVVGKITDCKYEKVSCLSECYFKNKIIMLCSGSIYLNQAQFKFRPNLSWISLA